MLDCVSLYIGPKFRHCCIGMNLGMVWKTLKIFECSKDTWSVVTWYDYVSNDKV